MSSQSEKHTQHTHSVKAVLLGPSGAGKTSLMNSLREVSRSLSAGCSADFLAAFSVSLMPTAGACTTQLNYTAQALEGQREYVELWDTAGQERFRVLVPMYVRGADLYVFVLNPTQPASELQVWEQLAAEEMGLVYTPTSLFTPASKFTGLPNSLYVVTHKDSFSALSAHDVSEVLEKNKEDLKGRKPLYVSNLTGEGVYELWDQLGEFIQSSTPEECSANSTKLKQRLKADEHSCC